MADAIDKKGMSERDICTKFITPAIERAGWDILSQVREEVSFTDGRIRVQGKIVKRGSSKRADYILYYKPNLPLAIIEAKDNKHSVSDGMQQAQGYAETLQIPFVFSSNGDAFQFHDGTGNSDPREQELSLDQFPSPDELWRRYCQWKGLDDWKADLVSQDYYEDGSGKTPRYYQANAINRTIEAIASGQNRALLLMATGTGKTYTAFQIIWRLWEAGVKKRILFLADRNILVDQTKTNDFKPFGNAMTKVSGKKIDKSYEVYLSLYQAITGPNEADKAFKKFSPDFFDLIVIDECHRGSSREDSQWREILEYFDSATHLGLTATPKETKEVSNIDYFGDPVYTYSLKEGIEDGFLAPYRVVRVHLDYDLTGWRPPKGYKDKNDNEVEDRIYNQKDFDANIVMEKRTQLVAKKIAEFLKGTDPFAKTIVFCHDIDHAERMRVALVNEFPDQVAENRKYIMRITGDENEGKAELDNFIHPEEKYPVIATTSRLMSTGVDAKTCKLIVLDKAISSMIEFKQIIGRGTRIAEDYNKMYFTIMDFRNATDNFADPDFDGDPVQIYVANDGDDVVPPDVEEDVQYGESDQSPDVVREVPDVSIPVGTVAPKKYVINDVEFVVAVEQVQHMDKDGNLITESLRDYTRNTILGEYENLDTFLQTWSAADQKSEIVNAMEEQGVYFDALAELVGRDYDAFDLVCHVAYRQEPLTRRERADNVKKRDYFTKHGEQARAVLSALLEKYANQGLRAIETMNVLKVDPFDVLGTPIEIIGFFGGKAEYLAALKELESHLYAAA
jgi:type I restriction enzyme R subunit